MQLLLRFCMVILGLKGKKHQFGVFPIEGFCQNSVGMEFHLVCVTKSRFKIMVCLNCGFGLGLFEVLDSGGCCILQVCLYQGLCLVCVTQKVGLQGAPKKDFESLCQKTDNLMVTSTPAVKILHLGFSILLTLKSSNRIFCFVKLELLFLVTKVVCCHGQLAKPNFVKIVLQSKIMQHIPVGNQLLKYLNPSQR